MTKVIKREHAERARAHESVLSVPEVMRTAPGIAIQGRKIRSLVFSTDLAVICHCDADAVLAVYPFTCQPAITQALVAASQRRCSTGSAAPSPRASAAWRRPCTPRCPAWPPSW